MLETILVPQVGQDLTEAKIIALHVKLGDTVKRGDIVAEVESEKATFEVEAFANGVVTSLPYKVGDLATVLEPLVILESAGTAKPATVANPKNDTASAQKQTSNNEKISTETSVIENAPANGSVRSSPLARRIAQSNGLDIGGIVGSGPNHAVVVRDVEHAIAKSGAQGLQFNAAASRLTVKTLKSGVGTPVVFLHGFGGEIAAWRQLVMSVNMTNPMIAVDLPGHGASPVAAKAGFVGLVDEVAATLRSLGGEYHLVGHSLGAAIAVALSAQAGIVVKSLTLIAPAGLGATINGNFISGFLSARSEAALAAQMRRLVYDSKNIPASLVGATFAARQASDIVQTQGQIAESLFEGSTQLFSIRNELVNFKGPCRVILGRRDTIIPSAETELAVPAHAALHRVEAGHMPFLEEAALVSRLIVQCVRSGE